MSRRLCCKAVLCRMNNWKGWSSENFLKDDFIVISNFPVMKFIVRFHLIMNMLLSLFCTTAASLSKACFNLSLTSEAIRMSVESFSAGDVFITSTFSEQSQLLIACIPLWKSLFKTERNLITAVSAMVTLPFTSCILCNCFRHGILA